jgi:hypothetical protein
VPEEPPAEGEPPGGAEEPPGVTAGTPAEAGNAQALPATRR